jgi:hypothetical protein
VKTIIHPNGSGPLDTGRTTEGGPMTTRNCLAVLLLALPIGACHEPASLTEPAGPAVTGAMAAPHLMASGTFTQTGITSLQVRTADGNTILEQTSMGTITGTLSGSFEDRLRVVIHPDGRFSTHFTITCECTVNGRNGSVEIVAQDQGQLTSPGVATFAGSAVVTGGTGALSGLRGNFAIEGTVDVTNGLSTYTYAGRIRNLP